MTPTAGPEGSISATSEPSAGPGKNQDLPIVPERNPTGHTVADELSVHEHGRQFNAYRQDKYLLPNDGDEQDRLDLQHKIWLLILDEELYIAPIGEPQTALDIGTGTGIWAKAFARMHPNTKVIGTDLSLIQHQNNMPPNLTYEREDSEEVWVYDHPFEYIHWRMMFTCFSNIRGMFKQIFDNLVPGGWAEFQDAEIAVYAEDANADAVLQGSPYQEWCDRMVAGGARFGRDFHSSRHFKAWMIEAGFVNVVEKLVLVPMNGWPMDLKDQWLGRWFSLNTDKILDGSKKLIHASGMPEEEIDAFLAQVRYSSLDAGLRSYIPHYIVYGQKP